MRPGEHPLVALGIALSALTETAVTDLSLSAVLGTIPDGGRLVLVVDQFEETFTTCTSEDERASFIGVLTNAATRYPERVAVILAIRGEYSRALRGLSRAGRSARCQPRARRPAHREELRRAIELPARRVGLRVESALVDALVEEVANEPGGLPLLSTALFELWQNREGGWIAMAAYERSGGVQGAVARLAESSYAQLSEGERSAARRVFLRLVLTGEGDTAVRRRVPLDELDLESDPDAAAVLDRLTRDRLLTTAEDTIEVAHEALLREWPRFQEWLEEDKQGQQLRDHLAQASRQWRSGGEEPSDLYRGARLSAALDWAREHEADLNELERAFLSAARRLGEQEFERQRRTGRRLRGLLTGTAVLLVLALVAGLVAMVQRSRASSVDRRESGIDRLERPGARRREPERSRRRPGSLGSSRRTGCRRTGHTRDDACPPRGTGRLVPPRVSSERSRPPRVRWLMVKLDCLGSRSGPEPTRLPKGPAARGSSSPMRRRAK